VEGMGDKGEEIQGEGMGDRGGEVYLPISQDFTV